VQALDLDLGSMPDAAGVTDLVRQQVGVDAETMTLREMQAIQAERNEQLRAANRKKD
jgi:hypothetical protein